MFVQKKSLIYDCVLHELHKDSLALSYMLASELLKEKEVTEEDLHFALFSQKWLADTEKFFG